VYRANTLFVVTVDKVLRVCVLRYAVVKGRVGRAGVGCGLALVVLALSVSMLPL